MDGRRKTCGALKGHESLLRLVGKRRKLHPSVFSSPIVEAVHLDVKVHNELPTAIETCNAEDNARSIQTVEENGKEILFPEWVTCPVCSKSIEGNDAVINNHLDTCLAKRNRRKSTQLTLFSTMKRISKPSTSAVRRKDDATPGKRTSVVSNVPEKHTLSTSHLAESKVMNSSCDDDSQEELPIAVNPLKGHTDTDMGFTGMPPLVGDDSGVSSPSKEVIFRNDDQSDKFLEMKILNEGLAVPPSNEEAEKLVPMVQVLRSQILKFENTTSQEPATVVGSQGEIGVKVESSELTETDAAKNEEVCICLCHYASISSCNPNHKQSMNSTLMENSTEVKDGAPAPDLNDTLGDAARRDSLAVVGSIDTCIVGRKFSVEVACKEGMELTFVRDGDNPKDSNAIKVLTLDELDLGYLPRQVALHLSVLLDKELGYLKGFVLTPPEDDFDAVPIQISFVKKFFEAIHEELINKCWQGVVAASLVAPRRIKYEANFLRLLQTVLERDSHLFNPEEFAFLSSFSAMSGDAQRLFIHLYQRKGPWFRFNNLSYSDVADMESSVQELTAAGYMNTSETLADGSDTEVREVTEVLSVMELRQLVCTAQLKNKKEVANARKEELVSWVSSGILAKDQVSARGSCSGIVVKNMMLNLVGPCIRVSDDAVFLLWRLQRLFFLNGDQELSSFLLVDMGMVKYPEYRCNRKMPIFATREGLLEYEKALEVAQAMDMALEVNDMPIVLTFLEKSRTFLRQDRSSNESLRNDCPSFLYRFTAARVYSTICTLGVSILEREHRYGEAVEYLKELLSSCTRSGRRGYWTVRLSVDLEHLGRKEESLQVAEMGVNDPSIRGGDLVALQRRVVRLSKPPRRWKKPPYADALELKVEEVQIRGRPLNCTIGMKSRFYGFDGQQCGVEELALQHYASEEGGGWQGMHSEGGIWMTLFGLLMWDIIFADVPDVFQTPFQTAPLDLNTRSFFTSRQSIIEKRLEEIRQGCAVVLLAECWSKYHGTCCRGINWHRYSLENLQIIAACVGGSGLSALIRLLCQDHAGYSAGMPDLLLWRTYKEPSQLRRAGSVMDCRSCDCSQETDSLELENIVNSEETKRPEKTKGHVLRGEAKLVEVKGPRDRLSEQQRAWIVVLLNAGLSVQVCKVFETLEN